MYLFRICTYFHVVSRTFEKAKLFVSLLLLWIILDRNILFIVWLAAKFHMGLEIIGTIIVINFVWDNWMKITVYSSVFFQSLSIYILKFLLLQRQIISYRWHYFAHNHRCKWMEIGLYVYFLLSLALIIYTLKIKLSRLVSVVVRKLP